MILAVSAIAVSFAVVYLAVPPLAAYLKRRGMCVPDVNKKNQPPIPRPGGPALVAAICAGILLIYWDSMDTGLLAILCTVGAAFAVGYVDDRRVMPGWFKPAALVASALPLAAAGSYDTGLVFPPFGAVHIPLLYVGVILAIIPITGNTINSIDVMNGVASGYICIAAAALCTVLFMLGRWDALVLCGVLLAASAAFYVYHRLPSRIFPGDSGVLVLGVTYGCVAIYGGVEVVAAVALLPCIINSFLFLHSVRRIVEHRQIKQAAVIRDDNMMLHDSKNKLAPVTLVRLLLRDGPRTESGVVRAILGLGCLSAVLAIITGIMMMV